MSSSENEPQQPTEPLVDPASANFTQQPTSAQTSESTSSTGLEVSPDSELSSDGEAPLAIADGDDISIDGTSVAGSEAGEAGTAGGRPERVEDVTEDDRASALRLKSAANDHFRKTEFQQALDLYTASLNVNPFDAVLVQVGAQDEEWIAYKRERAECKNTSSRSAVRLKREEFGLAITDATKSIELQRNYVKAYYRRAVANLSVLKPKSSLADFRKVVALDPNNANAKAQLDSTVKLVRRLDFEKAIASKDDELVSERCGKQLADGGMPVESDYTGPRLQQGPDGKGVPTKEFVEGMLQHFKNGKLLPKRYVWQIVLGCREALLKHGALVDASIPEGQKVDVIGDTHGQFFDVLHLLELCGPPSETHALVVNGDFVDRGSWSTEVVLTWFAYKWLYPNNVFLNRGNHETSDMNKVYGFEGETKKKYSEMTFRLFEECFCALPIATLVAASKPPKPHSDALPPSKWTQMGPDGNKRYLILHGGLFSEDHIGLDDLRKIDRLRVKQPNGETTMGQALWADPQFMPGRGPSKRGVGKAFGPDVTKRFLERNQVTAIIRSHEVRQEGYSLEHEGLCITVFSAPNYVDQAGNQGAFITIADDGDLKFTSFKESPHPPIKAMAYAGGFSNLMMA